MWWFKDAKVNYNVAKTMSNNINVVSILLILRKATVYFEKFS